MVSKCQHHPFMLLYWPEPIALRRKPKCLSSVGNTLQIWLFFNYLFPSLGTLYLKSMFKQDQSSSSLSMSVLQTYSVFSTLLLPLVILILQRIVWRSFPGASFPKPLPWSLGWSPLYVLLMSTSLFWRWPSSHTNHSAIYLSIHPHKTPVLKGRAPSSPVYRCIQLCAWHTAKQDLSIYLLNE